MAPYFDAPYFDGQPHRIRTPHVRMDRRVVCFNGALFRWTTPSHTHTACAYGQGGGPFARYEEGCPNEIGRCPISMDHPIGYAHCLCVWTGGGPFARYEEGYPNEIGRRPISMDHPIGYAHRLCVWTGGWSVRSLRGRVPQRDRAAPIRTLPLEEIRTSAPIRTSPLCTLLIRYAPF
jgi:hypothetical protein